MLIGKDIRAKLARSKLICAIMVVIMCCLSGCIITCAYIDIQEVKNRSGALISYLSLSSAFFLGVVSSIFATHFLTTKPERQDIPLEF